MDVKVLKSYTEMEYMNINSFDKDFFNVVKRNKIYFLREKNDKESYFLLNDISNYIKKSRNDISYILVINKKEYISPSKENKKEYIYTINFSNTSMPYAENLSGKIEINTQFFNRDIKKLDYLFNIINKFYTFNNTKKFLIITELNNDIFINENFPDIEIMSKKEIKKMSLEIPIIENLTKKISFFIFISFFSLLIIFFTNLSINHITNRLNISNNNLYEGLLVENRNLIREKRKLELELINFSEYSLDKIYKVEKND